MPYSQLLKRQCHNWACTSMDMLACMHAYRIRIFKKSNTFDLHSLFFFFFSSSLPCCCFPWFSSETKYNIIEHCSIPGTYAHVPGIAIHVYQYQVPVIPTCTLCTLVASYWKSIFHSSYGSMPYCNTSRGTRVLEYRYLLQYQYGHSSAMDCG